jgi:hypothetical protein
MAFSLKYILYICSVLLLLVNFSTYFDDTYGYQLIQYYNLTELVPGESYRAKFDITIKPHSNESYLLGSYIKDSEIHLRRNVSILVDLVTYVSRRDYSENFNATLKLFRHKDNNVIMNPVVQSEDLLIINGQGFCEILDTNSNWMVLTNNNNHPIYLKGSFYVNNYYYLHTFMREIINIPFLYHNAINYACLIMALLIAIVL